MDVFIGKKEKTMLRIRKTEGKADIKVLVELESSVDTVELALSTIQEQIKDGFDTLQDVFEKFDEVRIDKDGALHCKNLPTSGDGDE